MVCPAIAATYAHGVADRLSLSPLFYFFVFDRRAGTRVQANVGIWAQVKVKGLKSR
jgi:hypothetical protein